tara:strand:+ start:255 stop:548 length:294 start_codon:yes stop_codon:yes gene_type:complete
MDAAVVQAVVAAIGPAGVIVLSALWILARRRENGRTPPRGPYCQGHALMETLNRIGLSVSNTSTDVGNLRETVTEIKEDVRELRQAVTQHLQDHAHV